MVDRPVNVLDYFWMEESVETGILIFIYEGKIIFTHQGK